MAAPLCCVLPERAFSPELPPSRFTKATLTTSSHLVSQSSASLSQPLVSSASSSSRNITQSLETRDTLDTAQPNAREQSCPCSPSSACVSRPMGFPNRRLRAGRSTAEGNHSMHHTQIMPEGGLSSLPTAQVCNSEGPRAGLEQHAVAQLPSPSGRATAIHQQQMPTGGVSNEPFALAENEGQSPSVLPKEGKKAAFSASNYLSRCKIKISAQLSRGVPNLGRLRRANSRREPTHPGLTPCRPLGSPLPLEEHDTELSRTQSLEDYRYDADAPQIALDGVTSATSLESEIENELKTSETVENVENSEKANQNTQMQVLSYIFAQLIPILTSIVSLMTVVPRTLRPLQNLTELHVQKTK